MSISKQASQEELQQHQRISNYYQFQSKIYDTTRWAFLFGRLGILKHIPFDKNDAFTIAEIGCGTGFNLKYIATKYPKANLIGVDVSEDMQRITQKKLKPFSNQKRFIQEPYTSDSTFLEEAPDIILFSYALTMINPQWESLIAKAYEDLKIGGKIMVADFHDSPLAFFKQHMSHHHVRMDAHILPVLQQQFKTVHADVKAAYLGFWQYFMFVGEK